MRHDDIERAVDTVLSGLTVTPARQEELIRRAMASTRPEGASQTPPAKANRVNLKLRFSLSFGLSHMIVAAIVVVIVMVAPLFAPGINTRFNTWQSDDGEHYMIQGTGKEQNNQIAEADNRPVEQGVFECQTLAEANQRFGMTIPVFTWMPDGWAADMYMVASMEYSRSFSAAYLRGEAEVISYSVVESYDGMTYTYVEQDGEGEHITLSDGRVIYLTSNIDRLSVSWVDDNMEFFFSGDFTREEAIRMAESITTK